MRLPFRRPIPAPAGPASPTDPATYELTDTPAALPRVAFATPTPRLRPARLPEDHEPPLKRLGFHLLAVAIAAGYYLCLCTFWAPAPGRPGIDENAYLVGGKLIAQHGSPALRPPHPLSYVGAMWILGDDGAYYPKYPAGLPLLYATLIRLFGEDGRAWSFLVSPACATLAVYFTFRLTRTLAGSFLGLLTMIVLATGQTTLQLANIPNSHAPALGFATAGMYLLVRWVQTRRTPAGVAAGFLLGYAVGIRYTQGLLVLPLLAAAILHLRPPRPPRTWLTATLPLLAWAVPVGTLALFNDLTMGHLTGYDTTRESTGFTWAEFLRKWPLTVRELHLYGLFFVLPPGLLGLLMMFRRHAPVATVLTLWFLPGTLLYTAYYWGQQAPGVAFLRFFLDLFPPLIVAAFWLVRMAGRTLTLDDPRPGSVAIPMAAGVFTVIPAALGVWLSLPEMARQHVGNLNLAYSADRLLWHTSRATPGPRPTMAPVVFADEGLFPQFLQHAQFIADGDFYAADAFTPRAGGGFGFLGLRRRSPDAEDAPVLIQRERRERMNEYYASRTAKDLVREQHAVMAEALDKGRPVYLVLNAIQLAEYRKTVLLPPFRATELERWTEPAGNPQDPPANRPLATPSWRLNLIINWNPQTRHLLRVTRDGTPATRPDGHQ